ncbi:hypothetical protein C8R43DRAFT_1010984 [Mycena crocata]|nr:hypothetical protein C8R43DRAFT_1010984 [Mycena crocata]
MITFGVLPVFLFICSPRLSYRKNNLQALSSDNSLVQPPPDLRGFARVKLGKGVKEEGSAKLVGCRTVGANEQ